MRFPENPVRKAIQNPSDVASWLHNQVLEAHIVTPMKARYLFDSEWDLAIILDACRYDLAAEIGMNHTIKLGEPKKVYSVASNSADWIDRTFNSAPDGILSETAYISGNLYTNRVPSEIKYMDKVWKYAWNTKKGCVPPSPITDRTLTCMRKNMAKRYVVHYMQPHLPPVSDNPAYDAMRSEPAEGGGANKKTAWKRIKEDQLSSDQVMAAYRTNLKMVLDEVSIILENVSAEKVVITSDHGNYFGEYNKWGHPSFETKSPVRHVPWWTTTAINKDTYSPDNYDMSNAVATRRSQLKSLGYI